MSDTSNSPDGAKPQEGPDPHSDPLAVSLAIEREKLKLERERLEIERDKLAADREDFEALMADAPNPEDLVFGVSAICVVAAVFATQESQRGNAQCDRHQPRPTLHRLSSGDPTHPNSPLRAANARPLVFGNGNLC